MGINGLCSIAMLVYQRVLFLVIVGSISSLGRSDAKPMEPSPRPAFVKRSQRSTDSAGFFLYQDPGCDVNCSLVHLSHDQIKLMQF